MKRTKRKPVRASRKAGPLRTGRVKPVPKVSPHSLHKIEELLGVSGLNLAKLLRLSPSALHQGMKSSLKPAKAVANRCWEVETLVDKAANVFTPEGMREWFHQPHPELSSLTPLAVLEKPGGIQKISSLVEAIEWGVPS